jgi:hypothetical protein
MAANTRVYWDAVTCGFTPVAAGHAPMFWDVVALGPTTVAAGNLPLYFDNTPGSAAQNGFTTSATSATS